MKAVILAGGFGTRLWPISRQAKPKQFQKLVSEKTMLQETIEQMDFLKAEDIFIATNQEYEATVKEQIAGLIPEENILIEPDLRNTSPCIGLIATILSKKFPDEVMAITYADHLLKDKAELAQKLQVAELLAKTHNTLNIIEVKARSANPNLGYVKIGKKVGEIENVEIYDFEKFTEKPDADTAKKFLAEGNYLWNTGRYVWKISTILEKYKEFQPETYAILQQIYEKIGTPEEKSTIEKLYPQCEKISIDYAIMEKVKPEEVRIISADLGWSDIGTWDSLYDELKISTDENVIQGDHLGVDTKGCLIYSHGKKLIATVGIENLVVVDTEDALLICNKNQSQDIKKIIELLKINHNHLL